MMQQLPLYFHDLIIRFLKKEATDKEIDILQAWLEEDAGHVAHFDRLNEQHQASLQHPDQAQAWQRLQARIRADKKTGYLARVTRHYTYRNVVRAAASVSVVVLALFATWKLTGKKFRHSAKQNIALCNDQPRHRRIVLPDSTVVWLNTKSSLSYPADFADHREVTLCGEAFFDVKKKQKQNFIVRTEQLSIQVKGTRFNVHAYQRGDHNATLEEGNIELTVVGKPDTYAMTPGDQITVTKDEKDIIVKRVDPADYSAWKEEKLEFDNVALEDIVLKLENRYHVHIVIAGNIAGHERLTMTIEQEPLDEVLEMIRLSSRLNCRKQNNKIIIYE